ncbi:hypothetical protein PRZ48_012045 [Zasmidium cellare]|uniref:Uncharacterized protein n=1 Tax=Zasmidium cellare TaxID=395010 RepID=A0ABR0E3R4_ZASCE|nr:hypothetical protein PRZ48_012045 [Zasmidium cellare]
MAQNRMLEDISGSGQGKLQNDAKEYGESWADRSRYSGFATTAKKHGLANDEEIDIISKAWTTFASRDDSFVVIPNGQILCRA